MLIYKGGDKAEAGSYINPSDGGRVRIGKGESLPGGKEATYLKLSHCVALCVAVAAGAIVSAALPFGIGFLLVVFALAAIGAIGVTIAFTMNLTREVFGKSASFDWSPSAAYLSGKKAGAAKPKKTEEANKEEPEGKEHK